MSLCKIAMDYQPTYSREDVLREQLDAADSEYRSLKRSVPQDIQNDQNSAIRHRSLGGLGVGAAGGAGLGAVMAAKGMKGPAALVGGLGGAVAGTGVGSILGHMKAQDILEERDPELAGKIQSSMEAVDDAEDRLTTHVNSYNPQLDVQKQLLALQRQQAMQQPQG